MTIFKRFLVEKWTEETGILYKIVNKFSWKHKKFSKLQTFVAFFWFFLVGKFRTSGIISKKFLSKIRLSKHFNDSQAFFINSKTLKTLKTSRKLLQNFPRNFHGDFNKNFWKFPRKILEIFTKIPANFREKFLEIFTKIPGNFHEKFLEIFTKNSWKFSRKISGDLHKSSWKNLNKLF